MSSDCDLYSTTNQRPLTEDRGEGGFPKGKHWQQPAALGGRKETPKQPLSFYYPTRSDLLGLDLGEDLLLSISSVKTKTQFFLSDTGALPKPSPDWLNITHGENDDEKGRSCVTVTSCRLQLSVVLSISVDNHKAVHTSDHDHELITLAAAAAAAVWASQCIYTAPTPQCCSTDV